MNRTPQHQTERARRWITGVALATAATVAAMATTYASSASRHRAGARMFPNASGAIATIGMDDVDAATPFFQELGTNGRSCVTCHQPAQGWNITPAELRDRFDRTDGLDPIFRTNDGSNCESADVSTIWKRRRAFSLLLSKGLIRTALDLPAGAEFEILTADDPYRCGAPHASTSLDSRPLPPGKLKCTS